MSGSFRWQYKCHFMFKGEAWAEVITPDDPHFQGMLTFCDGFYLDVNMKLAHKQEDQHYWIPPHKIEYIERLVYEVVKTA